MVQFRTENNPTLDISAGENIDSIGVPLILTRDETVSFASMLLEVLRKEPGAGVVHVDIPFPMMTPN